jgi:flagellar biosynthetic protein FliR
MIHIFLNSFRLLPIGHLPKSWDVCFYFIELNKDVFTMGLKLAMPMMAAVMIMDIGIGVLMRAIPQLNVFVLNIYVKFIVGFLLLLKLSPNFIIFSHRLTDQIFEGMSKLVVSLR